MKTSLEIKGNTLEQLPEAAADIVTFARENNLKVWIFEGAMGAGKTTLIKAICKQLDVKDIVQSPTFSIVNEYRTAANEPVYHFDFYRIRSVEEAVQVGAEEYFYSGDFCLIEWPSKVEPILPDCYLKIILNLNKDTSRNILISVHE